MGSKETNKRIGFTYAFHGIKYVFVHERNFRIHVLALFVVIIMGLITRVSAVEWIFLCIVSGVVLITEMVNSAIEFMIDYLKPDIHPSAKSIKDIAAGAVLIAAITAFIVGCVIFFPKIMMFI